MTRGDFVHVGRDLLELWGAAVLVGLAVVVALLVIWSVWREGDG